MLAMLAGAFLLLVAGMPPRAAYAAGPVLTPGNVFSESFDGTQPARLQLDWPYGLTPPAYWGVITQRRHTGSSGLWCAGNVFGNPVANGWTTFGGRYPDNTAGLATFDVPELANYYSSTLDYWYLLPSRGSADFSALNVMWSATLSPPWQSNAEQAVVTTWTPVSYSMSVPTPDNQIRPISLSRSAGYIRFQFFDDYGDSGENPTNGEGPTLDDVAVNGWMYGPVRGLAVNMAGSTAHVTWSTPWRSTAATSTEERPIVYRVYREQVGSSAWTELTTNPVAGTSFDDGNTEALSGPYRYVVQATDAAGTGFGEVVLSRDATTHVFVQAAGAPIFTINPIPTPTRFDVTPAYTTTESPSPSHVATLDGSPFTIGNTVTAEGPHVLSVRLTGSGGASSEQFASFTIDKSAPVTHDNAPAGIQLAATQILLTATDKYTSVARTEYKLDTAANWTTQPSGGVWITAWGDHTLYYRSIDAAGNVEATQHVHLSMRQPTTLSIAPSTYSPTHGHAFTVSGYLAPGLKNEHILVKYQKPGSSKWYSVTVHTTASGTRGKWSYKYTPAKKGTYHFKAWYDTTTKKYRSGSSTLAVTAK
jgi:hypothetical protein